MSVTISQLQNELPHREAIKDCLYRYSRGIDRGDEAMLRSCYWPDATDDHAGLFTGPATEYIDKAVSNTAARCPTQHFVTNILIRIDGDKASVESYYYAVHESMMLNGSLRDLIATGRYLDRFERRGDEWRISARSVAIDWYREYPDTTDWSLGPFGLGDGGRGGRMPADPSYSLLDLA